MRPDYKDLLNAFQSHGVKYLIVGGYAVIYHSQPRFTQDLGIFIEPDPENARATYAALTQFGASLRGITPGDFTRRDSFFRFGSEPHGIDILPSAPGLDFDAAWKNRVEVVIDAATGQTAWFIAADDLIANKLASARPQDLADVDAVRRAQRLQPQKARPS